ncbi:MAG: histidinol-phosphate transaminase [Saprospiraceae bacterium]|nr:histidinol-phosphate transaminase [Saprospiraceae bacterium]
MSPISRRNMLRGTALATASLPFIKLNSAIDAWREQEYPVYTPRGNDAPLVKLNSNENPYGPSPAAREAIIAAIDQGNRYPRTAINKLQKAIAEHENLSEDQVLISAGSTELLGLSGLMAGLEKGNVIGCNPTFDFLLYFAQQFGANWIKVPLTEDHKYNLAGINEKVDNNTKLVFVCNPNNPTGSELPKSMLKPFVQTLSERTMVYVDEAYIEFSQGGLQASLASMTRNNKNIIVARTFSKVYGLAGLRVGYAIAHPDTIRKMRNYLQGRSVTAGVCSVAAATACIGDQKFVQHCLEMNQKAKDLLYAGFGEWGVEYIPSSTNFVFFKTDLFGGKDIVKELQRRNVMIRQYSHVPGWARVSIGTPDEIRAFLKETQQLLA